MIFILDTNVISAARRADRSPRVAAWLTSQPEASLFLSVLTIGEIERGIQLQAATNPAFARDLKAWLDRTLQVFADRLLPFTDQDARHWGQLSAKLGHPGVDLMIAGQALARDATVVTRNSADFQPTGVRLLNPF